MYSNAAAYEAGNEASNEAINEDGMGATRRHRVDARCVNTNHLKWLLDYNNTDAKSKN